MSSILCLINAASNRAKAQTEDSAPPLQCSKPLPDLKPGKYRLSVRASLIATQLCPPDEALSFSQKELAAKETHLALPVTRTLRNGTVIRFTVLPTDAAALEMQASKLRAKCIAGSPDEAREALQTLMAWPRVFAASAWGTLWNDPRLDPVRVHLLVDYARDAAWQSDLNALDFLGYATWNAKKADARVALVNIHRGGTTQARKIVAVFTAHGKTLPEQFAD